MVITSIGVYHNNTHTKSETVKPASATEQPEVTTSKTNAVVTDSFTKSVAAEAISTQDTVATTDKTTPAITDSTYSSPKVADTKMSPNKSVVAGNSNTEDTASNASSITEVSAESTTVSAAAVTSITEYTTAEIAEYDLNGDGKLDAAEEAKMKTAQTKEAAQKAVSTKQQEDSQDKLSIDQMEAKESYETAKIQLLPSDNEPIIDELV